MTGRRNPDGGGMAASGLGSLSEQGETEPGDTEGLISGGANGPSFGDAVGLTTGRGIDFAFVVGGEGVRMLPDGESAAALVPPANHSSDAAGLCRTVPLRGYSSVQCPYSLQL